MTAAPMAASEKLSTARSAANAPTSRRKHGSPRLHMQLAAMRSAILGLSPAPGWVLEVLASSEDALSGITYGSE